ncbi:MAG: dihydroorotate dehydrogenase electron transfer subunit [Anaerolineae bacterium]|nr:dihydroorotate dehydrogenase electron transfer subunit [Phycisphaerae bacterium]
MTSLTASGSARAQFVARVAANNSLCREHFQLMLRVDRGFPRTEPGQFIQIACRDDLAMPETACEWREDPSGRFVRGDCQEDVDLQHPTAVLRRPFSLAGRTDLDDGTTEIEIIHRVVGMGTEWMANLAEGDSVNILGPLGNRFTVPREDQIALLVGGGVGIPPMLYLASALAARRLAGIAFFGALSRDLLPVALSREAAEAPSLCVDRLATLSFPAVISTDDGSCGFRGFVTQLLERFLDRNIDQSFIIYTCGPEPMMKRIAEIGRERNIPVQVAVERAMACGMGTCQSCCIRAKVPIDVDPAGWRYKLACTDGPIFAGDALLW